MEHDSVNTDIRILVTVLVLSLFTYLTFSVWLHCCCCWCVCLFWDCSFVHSILYLNLISKCCVCADIEQVSVWIEYCIFFFVHKKIHSLHAVWCGYFNAESGFWPTNWFASHDELLDYWVYEGKGGNAQPFYGFYTFQAKLKIKSDWNDDGSHSF